MKPLPVISFTQFGSHCLLHRRLSLAPKYFIIQRMYCSSHTRLFSDRSYQHISLIRVFVLSSRSLRCSPNCFHACGDLFSRTPTHRTFVFALLCITILLCSTFHVVALFRSYCHSAIANASRGCSCVTQHNSIPEHSILMKYFILLRNCHNFSFSNYFF